MVTMTIPTNEELYFALLAHRHCMTDGAERVWLCCTEHQWFITADRKKLQGTYGRVTIGKGDANNGLKICADNLIDRITHSEGAGY